MCHERNEEYERRLAVMDDWTLLSYASKYTGMDGRELINELSCRVERLKHEVEDHDKATEKTAAAGRNDEELGRGDTPAADPDR